MTTPGDVDRSSDTSDTNDASDASDVSPAALRRLFLLGLMPVLGVLTFATAGALALQAFSHNNSLSCDALLRSAGATCSHYSYAAPIVVGVLGLLLVMGGGAFASYYAARRVGLPLVSALLSAKRQRRAD